MTGAEPASAPPPARGAFASRPRSFHRRASLLAAGVVAAAYLVHFLGTAALATPIADDYAYFALTRQHGVAGMVWHRLMTWDGRFSSVLVAAAGWRLLGTAVVPVGCVAFVLALWGSAILAARRFLRSHDTALGPFAVGSLATAALVRATASQFDSFLWFTSAMVYIPPLALMLVNAVLISRLLTTWRRLGPRAQVGLTAGVSVSVFIFTGFNEPLALVGLCAVLILLVVELVWRPWGGRRLALASIAVSNAAGVCLLYLASLSRADQLSVDDPFQRGLTSLRVSVNRVLVTPGPSGLLLFIALGVAILVSTGHRSRQSRLIMAGVGATSLALVAPAVVFVTGFAAGRADLRTLVSPVAFAGTGIALLVAAAAWRTRPPAAGVIGVALALAAATLSLATQLDLARAVALRGQLSAHRELVLRDAVADGAERVTLQPAPILISPASATDFSFRPDQRSSMAWGFRAYFEVPASTELEFVTTQPAGYCLGSPPPAWSGALTCSKLARR